ncbi:hypothetical protein NA57DRAFT_53032 [Rhizodiscina lignyota]|uniref:mRNA decay factor PAT1 domain-containing protein n=1 Tax=Rhizodiscina lignyota TaxID=1504668 RepID=A0A9P4MA46_9PEZI|nr:hypothetical protein NA57DRAFT_53032 [Rhizodiscina lignyota]
MSFFGFDATLPRDRGHQNNAPGFSQPHDAFAGLSGRGAGAEDDALDFEDTYDGLADQLDEGDDVLNDDTFGGEPATQQNVGRDFDFSGQTARIAGTMQEEQMLYNARQPPPRASPPKKASKPAATGYEKYKQPEYIPQLEANASIWGLGPKKTAPAAPAAPAAPTYAPQAYAAPQPAPAAPNRRMMSLEEVEAMIRTQSKPQPPTQQAPPMEIPNVASFLGAPAPAVQPQAPPQPQQPQYPGFAGPPQILQRPHHAEQRPPQPQPQVELPAPSMPQHPQILQRNRTPQEPEPASQRQMPRPAQAQREQRESPQPRQILQNPNRLSGQGQPMSPQAHRSQDMGRGVPKGPSHGRGPSFQGQVITDPQQILQLTEEERAQFLAEEAKRAKRNHKIHLLSKDNGLMTPQDKNFITRIQLQQLVTATGNIDAVDAGPEAALVEDFYYQVFSSIRGAPRASPNQPANQFAQTYLFATHGRYGRFGARGPHGRGDNHMQRMEQQVQRAVEAAKAKPKNKQLVIEGSLGKISFSNAKTPKPLLNIKRPDSADARPASAGNRRTSHGMPVLDRKRALRDIENVYSTLLELEGHERHIPPPLTEDSTADEIQAHMEWRSKLQGYNERLWRELKVMEPIVPNSPTPHSFIAILSHAKGKKAIPRIFRHLDEQQRITILTIIVVHLDSLDVIAHALPSSAASPPPAQLPPAVREEIELFSQAIMPPLFSYVNDAPLNIVAGLLGLVLERTHVSLVLRTKIGLAILTMLVSRAELAKQSAPSDSTDADSWNAQFSRLFDVAEPVLPYLFPGSVVGADDVHVWQFLAAMGAAASPEQQQRLVLGVKERVMETVAVARTLPGELKERRLGEVNLFMRAIGLDVELLG